MYYDPRSVVMKSDRTRAARCRAHIVFRSYTANNTSYTRTHRAPVARVCVCVCVQILIAPSSKLTLYNQHDDERSAQQQRENEDSAKSHVDVQFSAREQKLLFVYFNRVGKTCPFN